MLNKLFYLSCGLAALAFAQPSAALDFKLTDSNPVINGIAGAGEWNKADSEQDDGAGLAGSTYAMWRTGLNYTTQTYAGTFQFLLHNIEQNPTDYAAAYNVFDIFKAGDKTTPYLQVWVFNNIDGSDDTWMGAAASNLSALTGTSSIVDTGFGVYNYQANGGLGEWRAFPTVSSPDQALYDWDASWGIYAAGGYNNSAFDSGLAGATDGGNQIFEVAYRTDSLDPVRRSVKDPDKNPFLPPVVYIDRELTTIPEPSMGILFGVGLLGLLAATARRPDAKNAGGLLVEPYGA